MKRGGDGKGENAPLFNTACHSSLLFSTGKDIFGAVELLNKDPSIGIEGIDFKTGPLVKGDILCGLIRKDCVAVVVNV